LRGHVAPPWRCPARPLARAGNQLVGVCGCVCVMSGTDDAWPRPPASGVATSLPAAPPLVPSMPPGTPRLDSALPAPSGASGRVRDRHDRPARRPDRWGGGVEGAGLCHRRRCPPLFPLPFRSRAIGALEVRVAPTPPCDSLGGSRRTIGVRVSCHQPPWAPVFERIRL